MPLRQDISDMRHAFKKRCSLVRGFMLLIRLALSLVYVCRCSHNTCTYACNSSNTSTNAFFVSWGLLTLNALWSRLQQPCKWRLHEQKRVLHYY